MTKHHQVLTRRNAMTLAAFSAASIPAAGLLQGSESRTSDFRMETKWDESILVRYLEIVTPEVEATCKLQSHLHGVEFGDADVNLGGARTAKMNGEATIGVRAPMHDGEKPVTRSYYLVDDIEAAISAAKDNGAEIIVPSMEIPNHGTIAIFVLGGIETGLWQDAKK
ncbi:MAG: hypothetical protein R3C03_12975 [Pirellulaceae bacterium]